MMDKKILQTSELARVPVKRPAGPTRRILVVEDEPDIRRLNSEVLKDSGYVVDAVAAGLAGWQALHAVRHATDPASCSQTARPGPLQKANSPPLSLVTGR